jgi:very-short-patch-repair endonuclease
MLKRKTTKINCDNCGSEICSRNFSKHKKACLKPKAPKKIRGVDYDPARGYKDGTRQAWNIGLNKENDPRIKSMGEKISESISGKKRKPLSTEHKTILSQKRIEYLNQNPSKVPYKLNHSSKISYPENYFIEVFSNIVEDFEFQYRVQRYSLDFANPKHKLYLEIDGEQHYVDEKIIKHDVKRTIILKNLGWSGLRIRWSEFNKKTFEEKQKQILQIKGIMKWKDHNS